MAIVIHTASPVGATPELLLLMIQACNEINQIHNNGSPITPSWYDKGLVAVDISSEQETIVGFLTYDDRYEGSQYHIGLGYVKPEYRGQGVYRRLWKELVDTANANPQIVRITRSVHADNLRMRKIAENQGCVTSVVTYGYTVRNHNLRPVQPNPTK